MASPAGFRRAMLDADCASIVRLVNPSSEIVAPGWSREIGLLWIDGDAFVRGE